MAARYAGLSALYPAERALSAGPLDGVVVDGFLEVEEPDH